MVIETPNVQFLVSLERSLQSLLHSDYFFVLLREIFDFGFLLRFFDHFDVKIEFLFAFA